MKVNVTLVVGLFVASCISQLAGAAIIVDTASYGGHTYHRVAADGGGGISRTDSQAFALTLGGNLVTLNDAAENTFVSSTFSNGGSRWLWTGLKNINYVGQQPYNAITDFAWEDGDPSTYRSFAAGEPNGDGPYVHFWTTAFGNIPTTWNDLADMSSILGEPAFGIVEIVPEPSSMALLAMAGLTCLTRVARRRS